MRAMTNSAAQSPASLSISIVLFHSDLVLLQTLLQSLAVAVDTAQTAGDLNQVALTLVDNSNDEAYHRELQEVVDSSAMVPAPKLVANPDNPGFGAGHNQVITASSGDYHLVLNPDVVLEPDALRTGVQWLEANPQVQLLSPFVASPSGQQEYLCKRYPSVWVLLLRAFAPAMVKRRFDRSLAAYEYRDACSGDAPADIELASGCFMLARTRAMQSVGGFDEAFFLYFEDFDLSLRLAESGRLMYLPAMRIVHHGGYAASKGMKHIRLFMAGGARFFSRHGWRWI